MSIRIISTSYPVTLQDAGRPGFRAFGVPLSGPMDPLSFQLANLLCGNPPGDVALEITLHGLTLLFEEDSLISLCGAGSLPMLDGEPIACFRPVFVRRGSLIQFHFSSKGCRMYLALAGGFRAERIMGSAATYVPANLGAMEGRVLRKGDLLLRKENPGHLSSLIRSGIDSSPGMANQSPWGSNAFPTLPEHPCLLRYLPGPEWDEFTDASLQHFQTEIFRLTDRSDRMGCQLRGPSLKYRSSTEMLSTGVCPGTVQVTHAGVPVILMADGQTTGGYPRIAQIIAADLPLCGQLRPGSDLRFLQVTEQEALEARRAQLQHVSKVGRAVRIRHGL